MNAGRSGSRELLDQMLARLGIDSARLPVEDLRDMTWTCTTCPDKRKCREWLADVAETDFHAFCPNAAPLDHALAAAVPAGGTTAPRRRLASRTTAPITPPRASSCSCAARPP